MLSKNRRIARKQFLGLFQGAKKIHSSHFSLLIKAIGSNNASSFSIIASKKVLPRAVSRARLRRRVYNIIKKQLTNFKPSFEALFIAKAGIQKLSFSELEDEITALIEKANILEK